MLNASVDFRRRLVAFAMLSGLVVSFVLPAAAQSASRASYVYSYNSLTGRQLLRGCVPAAVARLKPLGRESASQHLALSISLPLRDQQGLNDLMKEIYDPASPNFHHFLTTQEFTARFGPTESDYQAVVDFAKSHGLRVTGKHPNRMLVDVDGAVSDIEGAFNVTISQYQHPQEARKFYAPNTEPSLNLKVPVLQIGGLDNYALPKSHLTDGPLAPYRAKAPMNNLILNGANAAGSGPGNNYIGYDFRHVYAPGVTLTGTGQTIGLLELEGYLPSDITYYENLAGLPNVQLTNVLIDGFTGSDAYTPYLSEVPLDIEMVISMAPGASVLVYETGLFATTANWHDILNRMATDNLAKQLSCSWYIPNGAADPTADQIFQQMAMQGQSFFTASGDNDAYTGLISFPTDTPYVTQVGGTTLTTNTAGGTYAAETVWNIGNDLGSGGGISTQYSIPSWQTGIDMTASLGSSTMRNVPDVALVASNIYERAGGNDRTAAGTSASAPLWAGFMALVNQQAAASGGSTIGFANPAFYAIGRSAAFGSTFHDVTVGNNYSSNSPTKFPAVAGYDLCTGWGTPNGSAMINALVAYANPDAPAATDTPTMPQVGVIVLGLLLVYLAFLSPGLRLPRTKSEASE